MCFSATASFTAGALLGAAGGYTLTQARGWRQRCYAAVPLLFGLHQIVEGGMWLALAHGGDTPAPVTAALTHAFPLLAYGFWPAYVPIAVYLLEPGTGQEIGGAGGLSRWRSRWRRFALGGLALVGLATAALFHVQIWTSPVTARLTGQGIAYDFPFILPVDEMGTFSLATILAHWGYGLATVVAPLCSRYRAVRALGLGMLISYNLAKQLYLAAYPSVWCFFAACLSLLVLLHFRPLWAYRPSASAVAPP
jgi:hypothetical protein